jgi:hypothetical protein
MDTLGMSITRYDPADASWRINGLTQEMAIALRLIAEEVERAKMHGESFASLHEAYAVIAEELDELWDITRRKRCNRNASDIRKELVQIGAMAVKAMQSLDNFIGGDV